MIGAFQRSAFQNDAFQVGTTVTPTPPPTTSHANKPRRPRFPSVDDVPTRPVPITAYGGVRFGPPRVSGHLELNDDELAIELLLT